MDGLQGLEQGWGESWDKDDAWEKKKNLENGEEFCLIAETCLE